MTGPRQRTHLILGQRSRLVLGQRGRLVLGMMSGTSADGIDVALVRVATSHSRDGAPAQLLDFAAFPLPAAVRAAVLHIAEGAKTSSGEISQLNFRIGQLFAP